MKAETKKDMVAFGRMIAGIVLLLAWWLGVIHVCDMISPDMDCGCMNKRWLPDAIGNIPFHVVGAMIAIPGSYLIARIGGRLQAVWGLVAACLLWPILFSSCITWASAHSQNACYRDHFRVDISILFGIEVLAAVYFAWRKFSALRRAKSVER